LGDWPFSLVRAHLFFIDLAEVDEGAGIDAGLRRRDFKVKVHPVSRSVSTWEFLMTRSIPNLIL
jgi:hypothetical protein